MTNEREKFERDGYLIFDSGVARAELDELRAEMDARFADPNDPSRAPECADGRLANSWRFSRRSAALANAPRVLELLRALYGREPLPFQTLNFRVGTQQDAHSDAIHFDTDPEGFVCGVWIALEDIHPDSGPLMFFPGSHKLPNYRLWDFGLPTTDEGYFKFVKIAEEATRPARGEPRFALLERGQAIVWASNLWHGGSPVRDPARTRKSQVTHYVFEGVRPYTPRLAKGPGQYAFNQPQRIK